MQLPSPGQTFQRKYKLHEVLGRGGFAVVYRATDIEIGRALAIKILNPGTEGYASDVVSRFGREARVIAGLHDPHTITMFDFGRSETGLLYMVFEYVSGRDLSALVAERGALNAATVVHIMEQVLHSLREAHSVGILHRDIKPDNILVYPYMDDEFRVKVLDFGIAKPVATEADDGINITRDGAVIGTPRYMAPEQFYGGALSPASDLYSLGLVANELLTGEPAIRGVTSKETIRAQLSDTPVKVPRWVGAGPELCDIVDRMTAREPAERFATADDVLRALEFVEADDTERMVVPPVGGSMAFDDAPPRTATQSVEFDPSPGDPSAALEPRRGVSNVVVVAIGLLFGAGLVGVLMAIGSMAGGDDAPPTPPPRIAVAEPVLAAPVAADPVVIDEPTEFEAPTVSATPDAGSDADAGDTEVATPSPPPTGCGTDPGWKGEKGLFVDKGLSRRFWMAYVPKNYRKHRRHRVVIMLHKSTKSGLDFFHYADFQTVADRENLVVLAPDANNDADPWSDPSNVTFVGDMLRESSRVLCLDETRIYAIGHGSGADFAHELACKMPLSAIALSGFGVRKGEVFCTPDPPVPTILLVGTKDRYAPFDGGTSCMGGVYQSQEAIEADWRAKNQCADRRRSYLSRSGGKCYTWKCDAPFVACHLKGGHDWYGSPREMFEFPGCATEPAKFPHRDIIWKFLKREGTKLPH